MSSHSGIPDFLQPHRLWPGFSVHGILLARTLELDCHALLLGIFPTQGLLHWRQSLYQLSSQGVSWCSDHTSSLLKPLLRSHLTVYVLFLLGAPPPPLCYLLELISSPFHWPPCPSTNIPGTVPGEAVLSALWSLWMGSLWITLETQ